MGHAGRRGRRWLLGPGSFRARRLRVLSVRPVTALLLMALSSAVACSGPAAFSDVLVENVVLEMPSTGAQPARVVFDIAWDNSFRDELNWDAAWVFVKFRQSGQPWRHASVSAAISEHGVGTNNGVLASLSPAADGRGVFLERAENGFRNNVEETPWRSGS